MTLKKSNAMVPALLVLGALLIATDVVWTFTLAPLVQGARLSESVVIAGQMVTTKLLLSQKIFYLHVPVAIASFVFMGVAAYHALRFLVTKDRARDVRRHAGHACVHRGNHDLGRSLDALRVGRLVGVGASTHYVLHPDAAGDWVLCAAQRAR